MVILRSGGGSGRSEPGGDQTIAPGSRRPRPRPRPRRGQNESLYELMEASSEFLSLETPDASSERGKRGGAESRSAGAAKAAGRAAPSVSPGKDRQVGWREPLGLTA